MKKLFIIFFVFLTACVFTENSNEFWIHNEQNETLYIKVDGIQNSPHKKLAFIQHGLASNMDHPAIQTAKKAFLDNNYVVITFDSRYSLGKSGNDVTKVNLSTFEEDLETVVTWAKKQSFYNEPFALSGHSLGGASVLQYSARHPEKVNILVPITPVISGNLWEKSCMKNMPEFCHQWKKNGFYKYTDKKNYKTAIIPYNIIEKSKSYNANKLVSKISTQTLIVAAQDDIIIAASDIKNLTNLMGDKGNTTVIKGSGHNFESSQNQSDLYHSLNDFIHQITQ